jgi:DNA-binding transcriptional LysR family regulator
VKIPYGKDREKPMNEHQMRSFVSVAKHRSISRAAEELNISQQGLSRVIGALEAECGVKLFTRTTGGVELSDSGSMILPVVKAMLKSHEGYMQIIDSIIDKHKETITITYEHALLQAAMPFDLASRLKNINCKTLIAGAIDICMAQALNGTADLGFCHNNNNFGELEYISIIDEPVTVFMHRNHTLAGKSELVPADLNGVPQLFPADTLPKGIIDYLEMCFKEGSHPKYELKSNDPGILLAAIRDKTSVLLGARHIFAPPPPDIIGVPLLHKATRIEMGFLVKPPAKASVLSFIDAVKSYYDQNG